MLKGWISLELKYAEEYLSYEFCRQKVEAMTEKTAADIRQRERATRDFESDENAVDLADLVQRKTTELARSDAKGSTQVRQLPIWSMGCLDSEG